MNILIAEDDDILRKSLSHYLGNNGFVVIAKADGEQAIDELKNNHAIDLVITDLNMPYMGGMEIINIVRNQLNLTIPIIVLTSSGLEQSELDAFDIGASEFVTKPFSPPVLKARIEKLIRNRSR